MDLGALILAHKIHPRVILQDSAQDTTGETCIPDRQPFVVLVHTVETEITIMIDFSGEFRTGMGF